MHLIKEQGKSIKFDILTRIIKNVRYGEIAHMHERLSNLFQRWKQIDGAWCTPNVKCVSGVRDHRMIIVDVSHQSFFGQHLPRIVRPKVRRLQSKTENYILAYDMFSESLGKRKNIPTNGCHS